jgi:hypothetical protein
MTQRWNAGKGIREESAKVDAFLNEVKQVCMRHGMTLEHEDGYGAFLIEMCAVEAATDWFMRANIGVTLQHLVEEDVANNTADTQ